MNDLDPKRIHEILSTMGHGWAQSGNLDDRDYMFLRHDSDPDLLVFVGPRWDEREGEAWEVSEPKSKDWTAIPESCVTVPEKLAWAAAYWGMRS